MNAKLIALLVVAATFAATYWAFEPILRTDSETNPTPRPAATAAGTPGPNDPILVGAGDISSCLNDGDERTAQLLDQVVAGGIETVVFTAGDDAYENGTIEEFQQCYGPTWGRHKDRTRPALGNHEYQTADASGYFQYFGAAAGDPAKGYYSFDLGGWHIVVLNTNDHCNKLSCDAASDQEKWLRSDLEASNAFCTLAIWQDPRFSSSARAGGSHRVKPFWDALYEHGAEAVVNGDEHNYERFAPQTPIGSPDAEFGIREFVAGTGGNGLDIIEEPRQAGSEIISDDTYGVIKFTLHPGSYDWEFIPEAGLEFRDTGSGVCHAAPPPP
jgi:acid phosphatase type 7